jgi:hypothetical protein
MCAKCHSLSNVVSNVTFLKHSNHISQDGFSCSICHTAHGMGSVSPTVSGERLVNFDANVVGQNNGAPISYNRSSNTCVLTCHQTSHNADGTTSTAMKASQRIRTK